MCLALLFEAAAETLSQVARTKLRATIGFTAVLHTWNQLLGFRPHLHIVVPAGGLSLDGSRWIAIADSRISEYDGQAVTFRYKDRADGNLTKHRTASGLQFARLFLQHVLPPRFVRIRHYGLLAARRRKHLEQCCKLLGAQPAVPRPKDASWVVIM